MGLKTAHSGFYASLRSGFNPSTHTEDSMLTHAWDPSAGEVATEHREAGKPAGPAGSLWSENKVRSRLARWLCVKVPAAKTVSLSVSVR